MIAHQLIATREKKQHRDSNFLEEIISQSLCVNCNNRNDCIYLAKAAAPIHDCELYECGGPSKPGLFPVSKPKNPANASSGETPPLGLCVNCDNRQRCRLKKPGGGVWHCEEYC